MSQPTEREVYLQRMLASVEEQNAHLTAVVARVEGLSRLIRTNGVRLTGDHIADMIDLALGGA